MSGRDEALIFLPVPATGEDCLCSCIICHQPRREEDGIERGKPVEWVVRMRLLSCTIWQGLHTECWERNRKPLPVIPGERTAPAVVDVTFIAEADSRSPICLDCGHPLTEADHQAEVCPYCGVA